MVRASPRFKLPVVLSAGEVRAIPAQVGPLDHRVALITIYSCDPPLDATDDLDLAEPDDRSETLPPTSAAGKTPACPRCGRRC